MLFEIRKRKTPAYLGLFLQLQALSLEVHDLKACHIRLYERFRYQKEHRLMSESTHTLNLLVQLVLKSFSASSQLLLGDLLPVHKKMTISVGRFDTEGGKCILLDGFCQLLRNT